MSCAGREDKRQNLSHEEHDSYYKAVKANSEEHNDTYTTISGSLNTTDFSLNNSMQ
jgi:hypothetical protein